MQMLSVFILITIEASLCRRPPRSIRRYSRRTQQYRLHLWL